MRIRVLELPGEQFILIVDGYDGPALNFKVGDFLREHLIGCGGLIAFPQEVEVL